MFLLLAPFIQLTHSADAPDGLQFVAKGGQVQGTTFGLSYVEFPLDCSYNLIKRGLLGLPGGFRIHLAPYSALALRQTESLVKRWDYGIKPGVSAFLGATSNLELALSYGLGLRNVSQLNQVTAYNRGFYLTSVFIF